MKIELIKCNKNHIDKLFYFINELAKHQNSQDEVKLDKKRLMHFFPNQHGNINVYLIKEKSTKAIIGYLVYFLNFSTFEWKHGIFVEDIYISPEYRSKGYGRDVFTLLARIAKENDYSRIEWCSVKTNKRAIDFYKSIGAKILHGKYLLRMDSRQIDDFAK